MQTYLRVSFYVFITTLLGPGLAQAADPSSSKAQTLDTVVVAAQRAPIPSLSLANAAGHITVIDAEDIRESTAQNLPALLKTQAGIQVSDAVGFGLGSDSTVNMRGVVNSARSGVLVIVDGVPQNRLTGDEVHWQSIPLEAIERIEILRGGSGILYGEGALAGTILITTQSGSSKLLESEVGGSIGSYGQHSAYTMLKGSSEAFSYSGSIHRDLLSGYRESTSTRTSTARTQAGWSPSESLSFDAQILHSQDTTRYTGGITPQQSQARRRQAGAFTGFFDSEQTQAGITALYGSDTGFSASATAYTSVYDSDSVSIYGRFATLTGNRGLRLAAAYEGAFAKNATHHLVMGTDLSDQKASTGNRSGSYAESNKQAYGLFLEESFVFNSQLTIDVGFRYDHARFAEALTFPVYVGTLAFEGWTPKLGVTYEPTEALALYTVFSRPFKAPNVDDFSAFLPGGSFQGNVSLQAQQGEEYEVGFHWKNSRLGNMQAAVFHKRVDREILFNALSFQNQNFDTRRSGLEWTHTLPILVDNLDISWSYTYLEAEFRKGAFKGNSLPGVPEHTFTTHLQYALPYSFQPWLEWRLVHDGYRINDFANGLPMDNYGVLDGGVKWTRGGWSVHFTVENISNEEYTSFQTSSGTVISTGENPAPPRTYLLGARVRF